MPAARPSPVRAPSERWHVDAGDAAVAALHVPADAGRERRFEVSCSALVRVPEGAAAEPWLQMTVHADGRQQWQRRIACRHTGSGGGSEDSLDYRFQRTVPVGRSLRVTVTVDGRGIVRYRLRIEADEA